jgi:hypothetical protein
MEAKPSSETLATDYKNPRRAITNIYETCCLTTFPWFASEHEKRKFLVWFVTQIPFGQILGEQTYIKTYHGHLLQFLFDIYSFPQIRFDIT